MAICGHEAYDRSGFPSSVLEAVEGTQDRQLVAIVQCTEAVAHYIEERYAPHRLDQFLTEAERAEVAKFIDSLGSNPARENEFYERRSSLPSRIRNPNAGWNVETARVALEEATKLQNDTNLPDFVRDCLVILQHLIAYLDSLHGSAGFREVLTPAERQQVGQVISQLLDRQPD